jgi:hypothetical protein
VPDSRWSSLFNVRFVITDKVGDAWFDGVFYDLQMGAALAAGEEAAVGHVPELATTALGVVYRADSVPEGAPVAEIEVTMVDGQQRVLVLRADATDAGDRVARLPLGEVATLSAIKVRGAWKGNEVTTRALSLIDERTGAFQSVVLSDSGRYRLVHSGDVKIYENLDVLPRAFVVSQAIVAANDEIALATMRDPSFDPATDVVLADSPSIERESPGERRVTGSTDNRQERADTQLAQTELILYEPEQIIASVTTPSDGWLVLSDAWYPGWEATVDGQPVPIERANILFRAVAIPAGRHRVEWVFRPTFFRLGAVVSLVAMGVVLVGAVWLGRKRLSA